MLRYVLKANFIFLQKRRGYKTRIEQLRNEKGIRQEELTRELGVSRQTISSLENGRYNTSIASLHGETLIALVTNAIRTAVEYNRKKQNEPDSR